MIYNIPPVIIVLHMEKIGRGCHRIMKGATYIIIPLSVITECIRPMGRKPPIIPGKQKHKNLKPKLLARKASTSKSP